MLADLASPVLVAGNTPGPRTRCSSSLLGGRSVAQLEDWSRIHFFSQGGKDPPYLHNDTEGITEMKGRAYKRLPNNCASRQKSNILRVSTRKKECEGTQFQREEHGGLKESSIPGVLPRINRSIATHMSSNSTPMAHAPNERHLEFEVVLCNAITKSKS